MARRPDRRADRRDGPGAGRQFIAELLGAATLGEPRRAVEEVVRRWGGATVYLPRASRIEAATRAVQALRAAGVSSPESVRILRNRLGVSDATARRYLRQRSKVQET